MSAGVAGTPRFRPTNSYTTLRDVTVLVQADASVGAVVRATIC